MTAGRRASWSRAAERLVVCSFFLGFLLLLAWAWRDSGARAAEGRQRIALVLQDMGYGAPRVWNTGNVLCPGQFAYRWTAPGAKGRACVSRHDGAIQLKVEKDWRADGEPRTEHGI